jgi:hypothetical protein
MTEKQIPIEEALKLVEFEFAQGEWRVVGVKTNVGLYVWGTIRGRDWEFVETPEEKFRRLLDATGDKKLIDAFHQFNSTQPATKS